MAGMGSVQLGVRAQNQETSSSRHHWLIAAPGMLLTSCRQRASDRRSLRARAGRARPSRPARLPKCVCARYYAATAHVATAARLPQSRGVRAEMAAVKVCAGDKQRMNTGRLSGQRMSCGRVWKNICQE